MREVALLLCLLVGAVLLGVGIRMLRRAAVARRTWREVPGYVSDARMDGRFGATITYLLPGDRPHSFRVPALRGERRWSDGEQVAVLVNPVKPVEFRLPDAPRPWVAPALCLAGAGFLVAALAVALLG